MGVGYWLDPGQNVAGLIKRWNPRRCRTEKEYERSLVRFLESKLQGKEVVPQYASGRVRGDIVIDKKVLIEIKVNLSSIAKLRTLLGQIDLYASEWKRDVVIVLCGRHDKNLVQQLKKSMKRRIHAMSILELPWLSLVVK